MKRYFFTFGENTPLRDCVQPVMAKSMNDAKRAMCRFYAIWRGAYENEPDHSGRQVKELPTIVISGEIMKVE